MRQGFCLNSAEVPVSSQIKLSGTVGVRFTPSSASLIAHPRGRERATGSGWLAARQGRPEWGTQALVGPATIAPQQFCVALTVDQQDRLGDAADQGLVATRCGENPHQRPGGAEEGGLLARDGPTVGGQGDTGVDHLRIGLARVGEAEVDHAEDALPVGERRS